MEKYSPVRYPKYEIWLQSMLVAEGKRIGDMLRDDPEYDVTSLFYADRYPSEVTQLEDLAQLSDLVGAVLSDTKGTEAFRKRIKNLIILHDTIKYENKNSVGKIQRLSGTKR